MFRKQNQGQNYIEPHKLLSNRPVLVEKIPIHCLQSCSEWWVFSHTEFLTIALCYILHVHALDTNLLLILPSLQYKWISIYIYIYVRVCIYEWFIQNPDNGNWSEHVLEHPSGLINLLPPPRKSIMPAPVEQKWVMGRKPSKGWATGSEPEQIQRDMVSINAIQLEEPPPEGAIYDLVCPFLDLCKRL